jgi:lipopolysaccharide assembly outer membrane protein LptD (OstA)
MTKLRAPLFLLLLWFSVVAGFAADKPPVNLEAQKVLIDSKGDLHVDVSNAVVVWTNDVIVQVLTSIPSSNLVMMADRVMMNTNSGDMEAVGNIRVQQGNMTWTGPRLHANFYTRQMDWENFKAGEAPFYVAGGELHVDGTNRVFSATNAMVTTDDYATPLETVRAGRVTFVPDQYIEARNAVLYLGDVPVFYFPYYHHNITETQNHFTFLPGYRGIFGPYLLSTYDYTLSKQLSGAIHADYREQRGFGTGPDFDFNFGNYGTGTASYYYTYDRRPDLDQVTNSAQIPHNRQRAYLAFQATPLTNLNIIGQAAYLSDPFVTHDFFETQYQKDIEPNTFADAEKMWPNWSFDTLVQGQLDPFYETVERLPEAQLTGWRQQIFGTPFFYESQSSAGYFRRQFADTNTVQTNYQAVRADTFHQITLPETFFGWLNVTPRVGGRFTYYGPASGPGATTTNEDRSMLNTGIEVSFKASQVWPEVRNDFFDVTGLRHIIQPSINYAYVPRPNVQPMDVPQFDSAQSNILQLAPLDFPDNNAIDALDSLNTIRFGLNNRLQTKRDSNVVDLVYWDVEADWRLRHDAGQTTFSDIYSTLELRPRSWLTIESQTRYDIGTGRFNLAEDSIILQPNSTWNLSLGQFFLRNDPVFGVGNDLFNATFFYRLNENWGARVQENFDAKTGTLQEQDYSIYRDLRSWTAALTFRALDNISTGHDYGVAVTFSFKAFPRFGLGQDTVNAGPLVGY